jgi:PHD/YefM family antitoxin component YafN of YafNO toxin-antitoxin module
MSFMRTVSFVEIVSEADDPMDAGMQVKVMGAEEVRREWRTVVDSVLAGEDVVVERYSRPAVAVIAYDDYTAIRQELEEMRTTRRTNQLRAAWQQGKIKALPWDQPEQPENELPRNELAENGITTKE